MYAGYDRFTGEYEYTPSDPLWGNIWGFLVVSFIAYISGLLGSSIVIRLKYWLFGGKKLAPTDGVSFIDLLGACLFPALGYLFSADF